MHAECHSEVVETKGKEDKEGGVNFAKFGEIANPVNSLGV